MSRREIAALACKLFALWLFTDAATKVGAIIALIIATITALIDGSFRWADHLLAFLVPGIALGSSVVVGIVLWRYAARIAARMATDDPAPVTASDFTPQLAAAIAFAAVGVFLLVPTLRNLASFFYRVAAGPAPARDWFADHETQAYLCSRVLELLFALWLVFGSRGIVRLLWLLRYPRVMPADRE